MKHAILLALIEAMRAKGAVRVVETHAGAGLYDLQGEAATRSSEAEGGIALLMAADNPPPPLRRLREAVASENSPGRVRFYPGSPLLAVGEAEGYLGYELRPDDFDSLAALLRNRATEVKSDSPSTWSSRSDGWVRAIQADGYAALADNVRRGDLVLIDPPFERADDYDQAAKAVGVCIAHKAAVAVWTPLKDLETLDAFVRRIEALTPSSLILAEVRLRPLANPMKMNGCAMVLVNTPDLGRAAGEICRWTAQVCGEAGGRGAVSQLIP